MSHRFIDNLKFIMIPICRKNMIFLFHILGEIITTVSAPVIGIILTTRIVEMLDDDTIFISIIFSILSISLGYALVSGLQTFFFRINFGNCIHTRFSIFYRMVAEKQMSLPLYIAEDRETIKMQEKASKAVAGNWSGIEGFLRNFIRIVVSVAGLCTYSFIVGRINPIIVLLLLVITGITLFADAYANNYFTKKRDVLIESSITTDYINDLMQNSSGGKDIRMYGLKPWILQKYENELQAQNKIYRRVDGLLLLSKCVKIFLDAIRNLVGYLFLISELRQGLAITEFIFYLGIIGGFTSWFDEISRRIVGLLRCNKEVSGYREFLDLQWEKDGSEKINADFSSVEILAEDVAFQYAETETPIISNLSLHIKPGEHVALVGLNGVGKSTLIKLLSGLYFPISGSITINGVNTRDLDISKYMNNQSTMFQDLFIMSYSIAENIALSEEWDEERIWDCIKKADLEEKIQSLPDGIHTYLGKDIADNGISLSGGESQKLLLARALYRDSSLIIFDEPTASMDAVSEEEFYLLFGNVLKGKTVLFVSHRLSSTRFCDRILVLKNGSIAEEGTHEELLKQNGIYSELFQLQSKYYTDNIPV